MAPPGKLPLRPTSSKQTQHRFPQPSYPPNLYIDLVHAICRRNGDSAHLPSVTDYLNSPKAFRGWDEIYMGVDKLINALNGKTAKTQLDRAHSNHYIHSDYRLNQDIGARRHAQMMIRGQAGLTQQQDYRPSLPPDLRAAIENTLTTIQAEAVQLGKDVELNQFRVKRGDPRGKEESAVADMRDRCGKAWLAAVRNCVSDVEIYQTGMEGEILRAEDESLQRRSRERNSMWGGVVKL